MLDLGRPRRNENHQARKRHHGKLPADPTEEKQMKIRVWAGLFDITGCSFHPATSFSQSDFHTPTAGFCA